MGGFLRIVAGAQMGAGVVAFLASVWFLTDGALYGLARHWFELWVLLFLSWGLSCLGGILWCVTRMAYPR